MILEIFSIYDEKASAYLQPFFMQNEQQAVRAILDIMHDGSHTFYRFASDYTFYRLGNIDNVTGIIFSDLKVISPLIMYRSMIQLQNENQSPLFPEKKN